VTKTAEPVPQKPKQKERRAANLGVREVADRLVPHVVQEMLHLQAFELVHPHPIVVRELRLGAHQAHLHITPVCMGWLRVC
jgi:hypothetical protein